MYTFQQCIEYFDIAGRSSARGRQPMVGLGKQAIFELNASISRKRQQIDTSKLLLMSNRKLDIRFLFNLLPPRLMTLDAWTLTFYQTPDVSLCITIHSTLNVLFNMMFLAYLL